MWIYYYITYGPGHQSHDYGFEYFHKNFPEEDIKNFFLGRYDDWHDPVLRFWKIKNPPESIVKRRIKKTKEEIEGLKEYLKVLEEVECFHPEEETTEDPTFKKNLQRVIMPDLLTKLHKAGFMYSANDVSLWRGGIAHPIEPSRSKILRIIRRTKKYPSYK